MSLVKSKQGMAGTQGGLYYGHHSGVMEIGRDVNPLGGLTPTESGIYHLIVEALITGADSSGDYIELFNVGTTVRLPVVASMIGTKYTYEFYGQLTAGQSIRVINRGVVATNFFTISGMKVADLPS